MKVGAKCGRRFERCSLKWTAGCLDGHETSRTRLDRPDLPFPSVKLEQSLRGLVGDRYRIVCREGCSPKLGAHKVWLEPDVSLKSASIFEQQDTEAVSLRQNLTSFINITAVNKLQDICTFS